MIAEPAPIWKKKPDKTGISIKKGAILGVGLEKTLLIAAKQCLL